MTKNHAGSNIVRAFKASGCIACRRRYPEVEWAFLELDHIDPATMLHRAARISRLPFEQALAELLKCQVLCRDCHRAKTNGRVIVLAELVGLGDAQLTVPGTDEL